MLATKLAIVFSLVSHQVPMSVPVNVGQNPVLSSIDSTYAALALDSMPSIDEFNKRVVHEYNFPQENPVIRSITVVYSNTRVTSYGLEVVDRASERLAISAEITSGKPQIFAITTEREEFGLGYRSKKIFLDDGFLSRGVVSGVLTLQPYTGWQELSVFATNEARRAVVLRLYNRLNFDPRVDYGVSADSLRLWDIDYGACDGIKGIYPLIRIRAKRTVRKQECYYVHTQLREKLIVISIHYRNGRTKEPIAFIYAEAPESDDRSDGSRKFHAVWGLANRGFAQSGNVDKQWQSVVAWPNKGIQDQLQDILLKGWKKSD